jgi:hypothetical protein
MTYPQLLVQIDKLNPQFAEALRVEELAAIAA